MVRALVVIVCTGCLTRPSGGNGAAITDVQSVFSDSAATMGLKARLPHPTHAGDSIVVYAWDWTSVVAGAPPSALTDDQGLIYNHVIVDSHSCGQPGTVGLAIYASLHVPATSTGPEITFGKFLENHEASMVAVEYSGLASEGMTATGAADCTSSPCPLGATSVSATKHALLASIAVSCIGSTSAVVVTDANGYDTLGSETSTTFQPGVASQAFVPAGAYHDSWQISFDSSTWTDRNYAVVALFE